FRSGRARSWRSGSSVPAVQLRRRHSSEPRGLLRDGEVGRFEGVSMKTFITVVALMCPAVVAAQDGAAIYKEVCAQCHDSGFERAPGRDALRVMAPERILAALESGAMISMMAARSSDERRAVSQYLAGKPFGRPLVTTPAPQTMCVAK